MSVCSDFFSPFGFAFGSLVEQSHLSLRSASFPCRFFLCQSKIETWNTAEFIGICKIHANRKLVRIGLARNFTAPNRAWSYWIQTSFSLLNQISEFNLGRNVFERRKTTEGIHFPPKEQRQKKDSVLKY